ncbi:MAG: ankyrin repeat domain-containing protein [Sphingomonadaceae bacterium]
MRKARTARTKLLSFTAAMLAGLGIVLASPAQAQFSDGYKFLEAVKKKEGQKVEDALSEPGTTVIRSRDVTSGETALHVVTQRRDLTWLRFLVAKGADVNQRDFKGTSPLQLATRLGWVEGVDFLIGKNANADDPDDAGETPLISAVHRRDTELMRILLKGGADPDRADNSGRSARDYAKLGSNSGQLLATIDEHASDKNRNKAQATYGPTL